jgi:hypothetical protein
MWPYMVIVVIALFAWVAATFYFIKRNRKKIARPFVTGDYALCAALGLAVASVVFVVGFAALIEYMEYMFDTGQWVED